MTGAAGKVPAEALPVYPGGRVVREMARRSQVHGLGPEEESGILPYTIFTVVLDSKLTPLVAGLSHGITDRRRGRALCRFPL